jgi:hypothetical protein
LLSLPLQVLAEVLDGLTNLPPGTTDRLLRLTSSFVGRAFVMQALIAGKIACGLLQLAFGFSRPALEFVSIHVALRKLEEHGAYQSHLSGAR